ncbi:hypothetical protein MWU59_06625 [Flavobacteriaceae bacterium F08102]|nr:hypothetical protein [Flavobacteriaceae bacterium F08102]
MKNFLLLLLIIVTLVSCEKNELREEFNCNTYGFANLKKHTDFLKHFKIQLPSDWKTNFYYDEYSSAIYSADTTKELTETFILNASWKQGELYLTDDFVKRIDTLNSQDSLKTTRSTFTKIKNKLSYLNLSEGKSNGYPFQHLQIYIKLGVDDYLMLSSQIYGVENVQERLCKSIDLFNRIELIK